MAILQRTMQALALLLSASAAHAQVSANASCGSGQWGYSAEMGTGEMKVYNYSTEESSTITFTGSVTWAAQLPDGRLALCNEGEHKVSIFTPGSETTVDVALGDLKMPVGAVVFEEKVWVACFGDGGKSGLAVVDPEAGTLVATYEFPQINGALSFIHNVYAFTIDGKTEIYVAGFGQPWANPKVPGTGMVKFDRSTEEYVLSTTENSDMNVRSIVQQSDDVFYVLEQIPTSGQSVLSRLERTSNGTFRVEAEALLPARSGDGGADVLLGPEADSVFATDRITGSGKLYYYVYNDTGKQFNLMATYDTGNYPRYTTSLSNGDVVACNKEENTISVFDGLMEQPVTQNPSVRREASVPEVSFFIEVCVDDEAATTAAPTAAPGPGPTQAPGAPAPSPEEPATDRTLMWIILAVSIILCGGLGVIVAEKLGSNTEEGDPGAVQLATEAA